MPRSKQRSQKSTGSATGWQSKSLPAKLKLLAGLRASKWRSEAHPGQLPPETWRDGGSARVWYVQGARGSGKTRTGAETFAELILANEPGDWACIGPTFGDARDTMIEHRRSGLLKVLGSAVVQWNRSNGELFLANGAKVFCDGADDGALRIQGKELRGAWCDEIGLWKTTKTKKGESKGGMQAWQESIEFAVREAPALILCTGTPKGKKGVVKLLMDEPEGRVAFTRTRLEDNEANLAAAVVAGWRRRYSGTRLGRQELGGEVLEDVEGALWTLELIEANRLAISLAEARRIHSARCVVAVDPSIGAKETSDECGIVAVQSVGEQSDLIRKLAAEDRATRTDAPHALVLEDRSDVYTPDGWAKAAIECYHDLRADRIVAEANQGGEMVRTVIHSVDPNVPVTLVWASVGKQPRAEPVSALYEQGRVHHVQGFEFLEAEQTSWVPGEPSPNRMDALVWGITDLLLEGGTEMVVGGEPDEPVESLTSDLLDARW